MAKLKNYEIEAIYNTVCKKLQSLRDEKLIELKKNIKLDKKAKRLLEMVAEYNALQDREKEILECGHALYKEVFKESSGYGWQHTTEESIVKYKAATLLPEKLRNFNFNQWPYNTNIKDRIIIANIDGNVEDLIENIVAEYND